MDRSKCTAKGTGEGTKTPAVKHVKGSTKVEIVDEAKFVAIKTVEATPKIKEPAWNSPLNNFIDDFPALVRDENKGKDQLSSLTPLAIGSVTDEHDSIFPSAKSSQSPSAVPDLEDVTSNKLLNASFTLAQKLKKSKAPLSVEFTSLLKHDRLKSRLKFRHKRKGIGKLKASLALESSSGLHYRGKHRENKKKRLSSFKYNIVRERVMKGLESEATNVNVTAELLRREVGKYLSVLSDKTVKHSQDKKPEKWKKPAGDGNNQLTDLVREKAEEQVDSVTVLRKKVSCKFRSYCDNAITAELNAAVRVLVAMLVELQDRAFARDPIRARAKKRFVTGLHEAAKYVLLKRVQMLVIAPDLENCDTVCKRIEELKNSAKNDNVPCVFALDRRKLGQTSLRKAPVSVFALLRYEGLEAQFQLVKDEHVKACMALRETSEGPSTTDHDHDITNKLCQILTIS